MSAASGGAVAATLADAIAAAFIAACRAELDAPKPGNVHVFAEGHGMTVAHFLASAEAAAGPLSAPGAPIGARIEGAVRATAAQIGLNTNLGIVLLCAPLAAAAERGPPLRRALDAALAGLARADAAAAFAAILLARPAGLGAAPRHDVAAPADATLLEAMQAAAGRDRIAYQYASGFADVFGLGVPALAAARQRDWPEPWPTLAVYLAFLAALPDSHIARKHGADAAAAAQREAVAVRDAFMARAAPAHALPDLLAFDRSLKARGLNPGTSADLTVATLFADRLTRILIRRGNND